MSDTTTAPTSTPSSAADSATPPPVSSSPAESAATPSSPSPSSSSPAAAAPVEDFGALGEPDFDGGFDDDTIALPEAEAAPAEAPMVEAPPPTQPQPAPVPPQPTPPQETAQPQSSTPAEEPVGLVQQLEQHRADVVNALAAQRFALTKEEADSLELDAVQAVPKLLAKVYYEAMQSTLLHINNFVPRMVMQVSEAMRIQQERENAFYGKHKALDRTKHAQDVNTFFSAFRQQNPQARPDDLLAMVAAAVMAKHGLQPVAPQPNGGAGPPLQHAAPPYVPARAGTSVRVVPQEESPFAGLGRDFDE